MPDALGLPEGYEVRYRHFRETRCELSHKMDADPVRIVVEPHGGVTIARIFAPGSTEGTAPVVEGVAVCHPRDNYNKALGRRIALGRALKALDDLHSGA